MACLKCNRALGATKLICRCGTAFCSDVCFVTMWHGGHQQEWPNAEDIKRGIAEADPTKGKKGAALLVQVALTKTKAASGEQPPGDEETANVETKKSSKRTKEKREERKEETARVRKKSNSKKTSDTMQPTKTSFSSETPRNEDHDASNDAEPTNKTEDLDHSTENDLIEQLRCLQEKYEELEMAASIAKEEHQKYEELETAASIAKEEHQKYEELETAA